jgi:hypothetical protein
MFYYLCYLVPIGISYLVYKIDAHNIIFNTINDNVQKINTLKKIIQKNNKKQKCLIFSILSVIYKTLTVSFSQYINNSITKIGKYYEIKYVINGKMYKMFLKPIRGPKPVTCVIDDKNNDITNEFLELAGPLYNFHGIKYKPSYFNSENIKYTGFDGEEFNFNKDDDLYI